MLFVDTRERWVKEFNKGVEWRTLVVGDFILGESLERPQLIIERKTFSDLHSSIMDNRYREQKARMLASVGEPRKILYIIEHDSTSDQVITKQMQGAILNTMMRDNMNVLLTNSKAETWNYILAIEKKVNNGDFSKESQPVSYLSKRNKALQNVYLTMLTTIPRVSDKIAKKIMERYPTMRDLVNALEMGGEEDLATIEVNKLTKVGHALALTIKNCLT